MIQQFIFACLLTLVVVFIVAWFFSKRQGQPRKTLKAFIQDFFADVIEIFHLDALRERLWCIGKRQWMFWGPRLTNRAAIAMVFGDLAIAASGQDVWLFIASHKILAGAIIVMNLLTPLTPPNAPYRIPGRGASGEPAGGPGADSMRPAAA